METFKMRRTDGLSDQTTVRGRSGKGREKGVVRDPAVHREVIAKVMDFAALLHFSRVGADLVADQGT